MTQNWKDCHNKKIPSPRKFFFKMSSISHLIFYDLFREVNQIIRDAWEPLPVWLGRLTHLLREAQSHWPPFCFHSQLCKNNTRAAYQKTRIPWNWDEYFKCLRKLGHFQRAQTFDRIRTITFKNGGHSVRALRCQQGREPLHTIWMWSNQRFMRYRAHELSG